jgi:HPt (histidine-containing phosphotransfer) domain-containing protein
MIVADDICAGQNESFSTRLSASFGARDPVNLTTLRSLELAQIDGVADIVVALINLFLDDAPRRLADMEAALAERNERSLKRAAHCLKGSSGSLGAFEMAFICDEIEQTESESCFVSVRNLLNRLMGEFTQVRYVLLAERQKRTT